MLKNGQLAYKKIGKGEQPLLAFHGFGQSKEVFDSWESQLGNRYTIYAFDLFYHGESQRVEKELTKDEWQEHLLEFIEIHQLKRFSILGYSLGGRFAIASSILFSNKVDELILIAPDGIFLTIWFKLTTTPIIRLLYKKYMMDPGRLEKWILLGQRLKLVNSYVVDFIRKEFGDSQNRRRVYISWNHFKTLGYSKTSLIRNFRSMSFKRRIILGSKDQIIKPSKISPILKKMGGFKIGILPKKHHQLVDLETAKFLADELNSQHANN